MDPLNPRTRPPLSRVPNPQYHYPPLLVLASVPSLALASLSALVFGSTAAPPVVLRPEHVRNHLLPNPVAPTPVLPGPSLARGMIDGKAETK